MWRGIKTFEFFWDAYYFFKFFCSPATSQAQSAVYFAKDRWPHYDFANNHIEFTPIRNTKNVVVDNLEDVSLVPSN